MKKYLCRFRIDGYYNEEVVYASSPSHAMRLIEARYSGAKQRFSWSSTPDLAENSMSRA